MTLLISTSRSHASQAGARPIAAPGATRRPVGFVVGLLTWWFDMRAKQRSRQQLGELDARLLRDIGIDRGTAVEESRRMMWH